MEENHEIELARQFIEETDVNVLLTGKAGTGKTTFLKNIVKGHTKRAVVVAPTGVAAINAGGMTLHSFFQLPLAPYIPGTTFKSGGEKQFTINRKKQKILRSIDLLIIDEISMVRADVLDAVDATLRQQRHSGRPFGGVQLLMIGDLAQLAPVVTENDRELLERYYPSPYFFESHALAKTPHVTIELKHVYRQRDPKFLSLLEEIRSGKPNADALRQLNERYKPNFEPKDGEGYIRLTTHNQQADAYNEMRLALLDEPMFTFDAIITDKFPEQIYPVDRQLRLKCGAQVMFCKNDSSPQHRYYNGKVGQVTQIDKKNITVHCDDDGSDIELQRELWENTRYTFDEQTKEIREEVDGTFAQFPLRYAWAITIHKSQGLTFDRCIVDAARAFASGQVYVALSRCRSLEGLVLSSPLGAGAIKTDANIEQFISQQQEATTEAAESLPTLRLSYERRLIDELFDFTEIQGEMRRLTDVIESKLYNVFPQLVRSLHDADRMIDHDLVSVAKRFRLQYTELINRGDRELLTARLHKACEYYRAKFIEVIKMIIDIVNVESDAESVQMRIDERRTALLLLMHIKTELLKHFIDNDFTAADFLHTKAMAASDDIGMKSLKKRQEKEQKHKQNSSGDDIENLALYRQLQQWRNDKAVETDRRPYLIANQRTLVDIAAKLPQNEAELTAIKGMGKEKIRLYGSEILAIVNAYIDAIENE